MAEAGFQRLKINGEFYAHRGRPDPRQEVQARHRRRGGPGGGQARAGDAPRRQPGTGAGLADGIAVAEWADKAEGEESPSACCSRRSSPARSPASPSARSSRGCSRSTIPPAPARSATAWGQAEVRRRPASCRTRTRPCTRAHGALVRGAPRRSTPRPCRPWRGTTASDDQPGGSCRRGFRNVVLYGFGDEKIKFVYDDNARHYEVTKTFEGVLPNLERRWRETEIRLGARGTGALPVRDALRGLRRQSAQAGGAGGEDRSSAYRPGGRHVDPRGLQLVRHAPARLDSASRTRSPSGS